MFFKFGLLYFQTCKLIIVDIFHCTMEQNGKKEIKRKL